MTTTEPVRIAPQDIAPPDIARLDLTVPADVPEEGCSGCCGKCHRPSRNSGSVLVGFDTAIDMAEAAANHNVARWNEIRAHADDPAAGEYCSSMLLGVYLRSAAHRLGVPIADIWVHIRRTGELPL